jgi:hypothetical protein
MAMKKSKRMESSRKNRHISVRSYNLRPAWARASDY